MNYRWRWLSNPWLRRPFLVLYAPVVLLAYVLLGVVDSFLEFAVDAWRIW